MKTITFNGAHERCLREQTITADQPGTVLHDFGMLLDFVGPQGVEAGGQYNMLPIKSIKELDSRLSRPLHLNLKRPQIRSHPYLQGLNLLLRVSGLSRVEGTGDKARLVLDPEMMAQWDRLNPTERYFNLLEAWLRFGRPEMVGERGSWIDRMLASCLQAWRFLQEKTVRSTHDKPVGLYVMGIGRDLYKLALMDLFGLVAVEPPRPGVTPWVPAGVASVPFGDAVCPCSPRGWIASGATPSSKSPGTVKRPGMTTIKDRSSRVSEPGSRSSGRISPSGGRTWNSRSLSRGKASSSSACPGARTSGGSSPCRTTTPSTTWPP